MPILILSIRLSQNRMLQIVTPPVENFWLRHWLKAGLLDVCSAAVFMYLFSTISAGPIISKSPGLIFAKFSELVELWLYDHSQICFSVPQWDLSCRGNHFFGFYRAMLCIRGTSHGPVSVCLSVCVCLSQVGVLLKRLNVGSHKQHHTISQGV